MQLVRGLGAAIAQARRARGDNTSEVVLRLQPATLGQLKIRVSFDRERAGVSARFEVSSSEARKAVDASLEQLRSSLEARGLAIDGLEVTLAPRERPMSDPLGLATGTPYAKAESAVDADRAFAQIDPDGRQQQGAGGGGGLERGGGGEQQHSFNPNHDGHHGPEARLDRGQGSTDAPPSSSMLDDAAAERPVYMDNTRLPFAVGQSEGGALRLTIDALA